jgi:hypothetical protein
MEPKNTVNPLTSYLTSTNISSLTSSSLSDKNHNIGECKEREEKKGRINKEKTKRGESGDGEEGRLIETRRLLLFHGGIPDIYPLFDVEKELPFIIPMDVTRIFSERRFCKQEEMKEDRRRFVYVCVFIQLMALFK